VQRFVHDVLPLDFTAKQVQERLATELRALQPRRSA
jgi:hypothetical protein